MDRHYIPRNRAELREAAVIYGGIAYVLLMAVPMRIVQFLGGDR